MSRALNSRALAFLEVLAVLACAFGIRAWLRHLDVGMAGSAAATVVTLILATWLMRRRGSAWRELGWRRPDRWGFAAAWTVGLLLVALLLVPPLVTALSNALGLPPQNLSAFASLRGDFARYLSLLIPLGWGSAAIGEELIYRGFIATRLADALGNTSLAVAAALLGQATLFALAHAYLGPRGMLNAGALGLASGVVYRLNGRNLWPLIVAHGLVDTVGITVLYLGVAHS
jgi:membrane protease YdiL (CAAX protease family)